MRTIGVSCLVKAWIASLRTAFGAKSTWKISTRAIFDIAMALTSLNYSCANAAAALSQVAAAG